MTLTGATPVQYSRGGFEENRKYQATGNGPRSVRRVSIIRRPITVRPVPPAVQYARVRGGGRRKTETIPGALDGRLDGDYRALTRFKNSVCRGRGRNRNARPSPGPRDRAGRNSAAAGSESRNATCNRSIKLASPPRSQAGQQYAAPAPASDIGTVLVLVLYRSPGSTRSTAPGRREYGTSVRVRVATTVRRLYGTVSYSTPILYSYE